MLNVYLLRHGQTQWNADGNRYCGRTDIPLTDVGVRQAGSVNGQLRGIVFDAVYSSPLERAFMTARIASGREDVIVDERLIEVDFGGWEGKTRAEFIAENAALWNAWNADPWLARAGGTGEFGRTVVERVDAFFSGKVQQHDGKNILVVGHNGINRLYLAFKLGMHLKDYRRIVQENSSVTLFSLESDGEIALRLLNSRGVFGEQSA